MKKLLQKIAPLSPWLVYAPFFVVWVIMAVSLMDNSQLVMDEVRYWGFATNLLDGHFHYLEGDNFLWSGPGYPLFLVPFVALNAPLWLIKAMNAVLLYLAIVYLFKTLALYLGREKAYLGSLLFGFYLPLYTMALPNIMTEALVVLLVVLTMFTTARAIKQKHLSFKQLWLPGLCLTGLVLTKIIFGYAVLFMTLFLAVAWFWKKGNAKLRPLFGIFGLCVVFLLPFLIYTFSLTGKPFYWGNTAGLSLYWMSSPHAEELGDWHGASLNEHPQLKANHGAFFDSISHLGPVEKDEALKAKAIENIKAHPKKFLYNCVANVGRTLFSHPLSYLKPSNGLYYYLVPNIFILVLGTFFLLPTLLYHRRFPTELLALLALAALYFGETIVVASYARFFFMIVPILIWWLAFSLDRFVKVDFAQDET